MAKYTANNGTEYDVGTTTKNKNNSYPNYLYTPEGSDITYSIPDENVWNFTRDEQRKIIDTIIEKGRPLTRDELASLSIKRLLHPNYAMAKQVWGWYMKLLDDNKEILGYDSSIFTDDPQGTSTSGEYLRNYVNNINASKPLIDPRTGEELDPNSDRAKQLQLEKSQDIAYNNYWNNIYDKNREGSLGQETYQQLLTAEQNAALSNIDLANAQAQQLGLAQAQTVKNITDQLKAERMSMLRAGMSESQIANQDMQQMIANTNALNEQIAASNMAVLQGRQQYANAEQTAYQNWLNAMNGVGTNASAMAATDAGNPYQLAKQYGTLTPQQQSNYKTVVGTEQNKK